jgi:hypothetical protein
VGVFGHWRVAVTRALRAAHLLPSHDSTGRWLRAFRSVGLREGAGRWLAAVRDFSARPERVVASEDPLPGRLVSWTGYACLAAGAVLVALTTWRSGAGALAATTDALSLIAWAAARYAIMRLAAGRDLRTRPDALGVAWAGGLVPLVVAVVPVLEAAALVASAALTWRALRAASGSAREATLVAGAAFGGQAAVAAVAWVVRGGLIYTLLLGR